MSEVLIINSILGSFFFPKDLTVEEESQSNKQTTEPLLYQVSKYCVFFSLTSKMLEVIVCIVLFYLTSTGNIINYLVYTSTINTKKGCSSGFLYSTLKNLFSSQATVSELFFKRDVNNVISIPGWGRFPVVGNGNPLQYSCLESSMDRGAWWATVHGMAKSWTRLSD